VDTGNEDSGPRILDRLQPTLWKRRNNNWVCFAWRRGPEPPRSDKAIPQAQSWEADGGTRGTDTTVLKMLCHKRSGVCGASTCKACGLERTAETLSAITLQPMRHPVPALASSILQMEMGSACF
jgi:hypothetical protein